MNKLLLTLLMLIATAWPSTSFAFEYQGIKYDIIDFEAQTCAVSDTQGNIIGDIMLPEHPFYNQLIDDNGIIVDPGKKYTLIQIREQAFSYCNSLTSVSIPETVTQILDGAFSNCTSLTSITMPNSVTEIGAWAFIGCKSLTSIKIPNGVTKIGDGTFNGCSSLTSVHLPEGITQIGENAFSNCTSLTSINIPNSVTEIGESAFCRSI